MARSYLFIPANVPRMLQNADVFEADALIFDLEDAVSSHEKDEARALLARFLDEHRPEGVELYVRVNSDDDLEKDLRTIAPYDVNIVLPKARSAAIGNLTTLFKRLKRRFRVLALIETPKAFFELDVIAEDKMVDGLILGAVDLLNETGGTFSEDGDALLFPRNKLHYAARAADIRSIDTPWPRVKEGLEHDIKRTAALGFDGKCAIHPNQVPSINEAMSPSPDALYKALRIIKKYESEQTTRFSLDGEMVDKPVIEKARKLLDKAKRYGMEVGEDG